MNAANFSGAAVAVVGMACRVPGANSPDELWENLRSGVESISILSEDELRAEGLSDAEIKAPGYVPSKGFIQDANAFDAAFFGIAPGEAALMDPQQRVLLECAWAALEDAGCGPAIYPGTIGVMAGSILSSYLLMNVWPHRHLVKDAGVFQTALGNDPTFLASRIAYHLNLRGPTATIGTACSTSLVAVHLACQSLLNHETDVMLAGGISIHLPLQAGYRYQPGSVLSPDGHCRPFDALATGTVSSDGAGLVVLKRLEDARADGDCIRAVILGSALNNDGSVKVGYTAPSVAGQSQVIAEAMALAGVNPESLSFIETHGAATPLGDPIEVAALREAFGDCGNRRGICALGSVKSNLGHLDAAAGVAGLIKAVLCLQRRAIPPTLHYQAPNPLLQLGESPFYVNNEFREMNGPGPLRAGVSSFGIGGTNVHLVLEEAPLELPMVNEGAPFELLLLSAKTATALEVMTEKLATHLEVHPGLELAAVAHTLRMGRHAFPFRQFVVCRATTNEAVVALRRRLPGTSAAGVAGSETSTAFMFPGLGDHYREMGWQFYCTQSAFRRSVDQAAEYLRPLLGRDIRSSLYPDKDWRHPKWDGAEDSIVGSSLDLRAMLGRAPRAASEPDSELPAIAQVGIFATEVALATLLRSWGIEPAAVIGHSIGEFAAARVSGIFSLEDALEIVAARARLIETHVAPGRMMAVSLSEAELVPLLSNGVCLSAVNAAALCVVAGEPNGIDELAALLAARGVQTQPLRTTHAYHSRMMEAIVPALREVVRKTTRHEPAIPCISCVTGRPLTAQEAGDPDYWARHVCETVRFKDGLAELFTYPSLTLLEVGPGQGLTAHAIRERERLKKQSVAVIATMRWSYDVQPELAVLLRGIGQLWLAGVRLDPAQLLAREGLRSVPLPTYPFERVRYWLDPPADDSLAAPDPGKAQDLADWFYLPVWKPAAAPRATISPQRPSESWLMLVDRCGIGAALAERLRGQGQSVATVRAGARYCCRGDDFEINPAAEDDYRAVMAELAHRGAIPSRLVHLWSLTPVEKPPSAPSSARFDDWQEIGFHSLTSLLKAALRAERADSLRFDIITNQLFAIEAADEIVPDKAPLRGPALVAPQEHPGLVCRVVETDLDPGEEAVRGRLVEQLWGELRSEPMASAVAYRGHRRLLQEYQQVRLEAPAEGGPAFRERGCYLITGGLGGVGLVLATHLASKVQARLALLGRSALPARSDWSAWLEGHGEAEPVSRTIRQVQALENAGAEVLLLAADVADRDAMRLALQSIDERFGVLHGVIHAAGNVGLEAFREIVQIAPPDAEAQFGAKVRGLLVLEELLAGRPLDFCLLTSSLSAVLGGLGFSAYSGGNLFMDAFAHWKCRRSETPWISVNWESWRLADLRPAIAGLGSTVSNFGMEPAEGFSACERIVAERRQPQVVVSSGNLHARLRKWVGRNGLVQPETRPAHERPSLRAEFTAPRGELESSLAQIWQDLFAITRIGIHDNFFELGGHSLLATQLNARIHAQFGTELSLATVLRNPTIAEQAIAIVTAEAERVDPEELQGLLAEVADASRTGSELAGDAEAAAEETMTR